MAEVQLLDDRKREILDALLAIIGIDKDARQKTHDAWVKCWNDNRNDSSVKAICKGPRGCPATCHLEFRVKGCSLGSVRERGEQVG